MGYLLFALWAAACAWAVQKGRLLLWLALWLPPLAFVSWQWLNPPEDVSFGYYPWGVITMFSSIVMVVAATGILSIIRATKSS